MLCIYCGREYHGDESALSIFTAENIGSNDFGLLPDGSVACSRCVNNRRNYVFCADCGKIINIFDAVPMADEVSYLCHECANNHPVCHDCNLPMRNDEGTPVVRPDGETMVVCNTCLDTYYSRCNCCWNNFYVETMYSDGNGHLLCPACHEIEVSTRQAARQNNHIDIHPSRTSPIGGYHWHESIDPLFFRTGEENLMEQPYLGVELEVDGKTGINHDDRQTIASNIIDVMPEDFIYFENDGSLDYEGFECITQPATLAYHESIKDNYIQMFRIIRNGGYRSHQTKSCGFHVHVSRDFFPANDDEACVARMLFIMEKFWDEFVIFSRRKKGNLERWAKRYSSRSTVVAHDWKNGQPPERYHCINLCNRNTFEFRIFRGTLKYNTYIATLQMVNNIMLTARYKTAEYIANMSFEELLTTKRLKKYWEEAQARLAPRQAQAEAPAPESGDIAPDVEASTTDDSVSASESADTVSALADIVQEYIDSGSHLFSYGA